MSATDIPARVLAACGEEPRIAFFPGGLDRFTLTPAALTRLVDRSEIAGALQFMAEQACRADGKCRALSKTISMCVPCFAKHINQRQGGKDAE